MKKKIIVGNWKSNKTIAEAQDWLVTFSTLKLSVDDQKTVVLCPSYTLLALVKSFIQEHDLPIIVGAQDISPYDVGSYTGAVNAKQAKEFASYVVIGHSERRKFFDETPDVLRKKITLANTYGLTPVYCIPDRDAIVPEGVTIVGYEPVFAIGTGEPDSPVNANTIAEYVKKKYPFVQYVLYGGSVTSENVASFTSLPFIDGVIPGRASLDPTAFFQLIMQA